MSEVLLCKKGGGYSIVTIRNGKNTKRIVAIHEKKSAKVLTGEFNVKLGSPIKETTMKDSYPEVLEAINNRKTDCFRFVDDLGKLG